MKNFRNFKAVCFFLVFLFVACEHKFGEGEPGELRLSFLGEVYTQTKSISDIPDTNDFILTIRNSKDDLVYTGKYGDSDEAIEVTSGTYNICVISSEFTKPGFDAAQYGDEKCVVVKEGESVNVELLCTQLNAGVKLNIAPEFLEEYPNGVLFLKSNDGKLMYSYRESRIAYFSPGNISLILNRNNKDETLLTRFVDAKEVYSLNIEVASINESESGLSVSVDTSRFWIDDEYIIGGGGDSGSNTGDSYETALSVIQAKASIGEEDVWVSAYIVGGDLTSTGIKYAPPFKTSSNLAIATRSSVTTRSSCISVSLPSGKVREALNIVSNPDLIGCHVYLKGDIVESYFGLVGLKNVSDFVLK